MNYCGHKKRHSEDFCKRPSGWGTKHPGTGYCKLHGGASTGRPIVTGRYSKLNHKRLKDLIAELDAEQDWKNLKSEIILLRGLIIDYIERYEENTQALLAWHSSYSREYQADLSTWWERHPEGTGDGSKDTPDLDDPKPDPIGYGKPMRVLDLIAVGQLIGQVGILIDKIEKLEQNGSITLEMLNRLLESYGIELVYAAREVIDDENLRSSLIANVERRWGDILLTEPRSNTRS